MSLLTAWRSRTRLPARAPVGSVMAAAANLSVALGGARVLDGVDLELRAGEVLALVGPNGSGKSTLVAALCGDVRAVSGDVALHGAPLHDWTPAEQAMRRAVLPQKITLSFPFTVAEVVAMGRAPWAGTPLEDDDEAAIAEAMRATDVGEFATRPFGTLSGGEQARVALAKVLAQRAGILLLDEPTAALDLHHQDLVLRVARARAVAGDAVVVVLHDLNLAAAHADRVAVLSIGRLAGYGPPASVLTADLLSDVYHHPVDVISHPHTADPIILPQRRPSDHELDPDTNSRSL